MALALSMPGLFSTLLAQKTWQLSPRSRIISQAQLRSYGIPSYGSPRPYQAPSGADDVLRPPETIPNPSFGDLSRSGFQWRYGAPADYSTPVNYQTPKFYGAPQAYGPGSVKQLELYSGGSGGDGNGDSGGRGDGDGDGDGTGGEGEGEDADTKLAGLSLSQKLTLVYAVLIGVGGIMGFVRSGSAASLLSGGGSALILYYVFLNLPTKPILSSIIGLGLSSLLLFVMSSRYSESGKLFPAGIVSLYSLVMTGEYIRGIVLGH